MVIHSFKRASWNKILNLYMHVQILQLVLSLVHNYDSLTNILITMYPVISISNLCKNMDDHSDYIVEDSACIG